MTETPLETEMSAEAKLEELTVDRKTDLPSLGRADSAFVRMHFDVWNKIDDHPRQRDSRRHKNAKHFRELKEAGKGAVRAKMYDVHAAVLKGHWYKVDGHTRTYLWNNNELPPPEDGYLNVRVSKVRSREELNALYETFDNPSAAERPYEKNYGALKELGLTLKSKRLRTGFFSDALSLAIRGRCRGQVEPWMLDLDQAGAIGVYSEELKQIDELNLRPDLFTSGPLAAALVMMAINKRSLGFWRDLNDRRTFRSPDGHADDPPGAILRMIQSTGHDNKRARHPLWQQKLFGCSLRACNEWLQAKKDGKEKWYKNLPMPADPYPFIERVRKKKKLDYSPKLFRPPEEFSGTLTEPNPAERLQKKALYAPKK